MSSKLSFSDALGFYGQHKKAKKASKSVKPGKGRGKSGNTGKSGKSRPMKGRMKTNKTPFSGKAFDAANSPGTSGAQGPSKIKKKDDSVYDLEQQFILRMPPGPAIALRRDVESGAMNLKDKLFIELQQDMRHARVTYGGQVMNAKLMDLPAVVQVMKTTDMKNFYVTADVAQMLVCVSDDEESQDEEAVKKKDKDHKWKWNHGITPPLKNTRKRRFRKTMKKKFQEQPDIEKEVRRLFRMDVEAIDVKWEVVIEDHATNDASTSEKQVLAQGGTGTQDTDGTKSIDPSLLDIGEEEIFGEVSTSEDEDEDEKDVNIVDSEEEMRGAGISDVDNSMQANDFGQMEDSTNMSDSGDVNLQAKLQELAKVIEEMKEKQLTIQIELESVDNYLLKERLQGQLDSLTEEENRKEQEYQILAAMLNQ